MAEVVNFPQDFQQITPTDAASRGYDLIAATETERKKIFVGALIDESQAYAGSLFSGLVARVLALETTIANLPQAGAMSGLRGWDTVKCQYKNVSTITLLAGGQYTCNGLVHTIVEDTDLSLATDLTVDVFAPLPNTWYHVVANGDVMKLAVATTASDVPGGVCLRAGCSTDSAGEVRRFRDSGLWYQYLTSIQLWSATMPTVNTTISLAAYVPTQVRQCQFRVSSVGVTAVNYSTSAAVFINSLAVCGESYQHVGWQFLADVFFAFAGRSIDFRCASAYPSGKLYLQAWSV